jgi:transcriptional regulator with XRE-family HTH domain
MSIPTSTAARFRYFRERAGLSLDEAARQMGISTPSVWDIESFEDELSTCYSPKEVQNFCRVLQIRPSELFGYEPLDPSVSAVELARLIHDKCRLRGVALEQFEDAVGWRLSACIDPPERLLEDITIDGLQWLCRELGIDWHRAI